MKKIFILGAGPGNPDYILDKTKVAAKTSDLAIVSKRLMDSFELTGETLLIDKNFSELFNEIDKRLDHINSIAFIVSGDPELYSLSNLIKKRFEETAEIEIVPGISSVSYFYSKLQRSLSKVPIFSLHGRSFDLNKLNNLNEAVILLDNKDSLKTLAEFYLGSNKTFILGEDLSYENEKITEGKPRDFLDYKQSDLSILSVFED